jgi:hypothetical protein
MRIRAILTIVISLLVGFVLGFLTEGQIVKRDRHKWQKIPFTQMFENRLIHRIAPSETQKEQILPIIRSYAVKMSELRKSTGQNFGDLRNQMNAELQPLLTDEQFKRLQESRDRPTNRNDSDKPEGTPDREKSNH